MIVNVFGRGTSVEEGVPDFSWCKSGAFAKLSDKVKELIAVYDPDGIAAEFDGGAKAKATMAGTIVDKDAD